MSNTDFDNMTESRGVTISAPVKHFIIIVISTFVGELATMYLLYQIGITNPFIEALADSTLLSIFLAVLSYFLLTRPLLTTMDALKRRDEEMTRYMENVDFTNQAFERQAEHLAVLAEEIEAERARVEHLALHDTLTGLPNRVLFWDRLRQSLSQAKRDSTGVAVLYLDLNKFKLVNDTLGHDRGDDLLKEVAERLRQTIRDDDTAARLGGDEFAVIARVPNPGDRSGLGVLAERIGTALTIPVEGNGRVIQAGTSIGIAVYPGCDSAEDLLKCADDAMFQGKKEGAGRIVFWDAPVPTAGA
ncbi:MAG: GGDEF domain-containing protein [Alphaproteobacteria bacterium]